MRIQKMPNDGKEDNGNTSGNGLTSHEKVIWGECKEVVSCQNKEIVEFLFVKHVMRPLLGHKHVNPGVCFLLSCHHDMDYFCFVFGMFKIVLLCL